MEYVIAIPSLSRPCGLKNKTLNFLDKHDIPKNLIYIFVVEQEYEIYNSIIGDGYNLVVSERGISNNRNFISKFFDLGSYVVSMDDDIEEVYFLEDEIRLCPVSNLKLVINFMINTMWTSELNLAGVYPVRNAYFMRDTITTDLRFSIGGFFIICNQKLMLSTQAESKEDYEQTIKYFINDGGVLRFNNIVFKSKKHSEGGLGKDRSALNAYAASYLVNEYPDMCVYKKGSVTEVRLKK